MEDVISMVEREISQLPISYNGNKKPIFRWVAESLEREAADCETVIDGFSGTGIISAFLAGAGKTVYACDALQTAFCMSVTLAQNPGVTISDEQLSAIGSHRVVDGHLFEGDDEHHGYDTIYKQFKGCLTRNECVWLTRACHKITDIPPYQQMIAQAAVRAVCCLQPYGTPNGRSTYRHRIKQKDVYDQKCLGHYMNSSYEIEVPVWFDKYCRKFNDVAQHLSSARQGKAICYRDDIITALSNYPWMLKADLAYFDPPYGKRQRGYATDYKLSEALLTEKRIEYEDFDTADGHRRSFGKLLSICEDVPKIIFSYDDKSWTTIDEITTLMRKFGRKVRVENSPHTHGKKPIKDCRRQVTEHLIIAERKRK